MAKRGALDDHCRTPDNSARLWRMALRDEINSIWKMLWAAWDTASLANQVFTFALAAAAMFGYGRWRVSEGDSPLLTAVLAPCIFLGITVLSLSRSIALAQRKEGFTVNVQRTALVDGKKLLSRGRRFIVFYPVTITNTGGSRLSLTFECFLEKPEEKGQWKTKLALPWGRPIKDFENEQVASLDVLASPLRLEQGDSVVGYIAFPLEDRLVGRFRDAKYVSHWLEIRSSVTRNARTVPCGLADGASLAGEG